MVGHNPLNFKTKKLHIRRLFDVRTGFGAVVQTLGTNVLIQVINIATGVITARVLEPSGRGDLAAIILWPQFLGAAFTFGLQVSLIYNMRLGAEKHAQLVGAAIVLCTLTGILAAFVGIVGIPHWLHEYPARVIFFSQIAMLTAPLGSLGNILYTSAQAVQDFGRFNKFRLLPGLVTLLSLSSLAGCHHLTPSTAAVSYIFAGTPVLFWNLIWAFRRFRPNFKQLPQHSRVLIGYGLKAWGTDLIGSLSDQVDRVLIVSFLTPRDMGLYVVAQSAARLFSIVPGALSLVLTPKIAALGGREGASLLIRVARTVSVFMLVAILLLEVLSRYLMRLVYGDAFLSSLPIFQILLAESALGSVTWLLVQGFAALGHPARASIPQSVGLLMTIPLLFIFVPYFGVIGAGMALVMSTFGRLVVAIWNYKKLFNERLSYFFPRISDIRWIASYTDFKKPSEVKPT